MTLWAIQLDDAYVVAYGNRGSAWKAKEELDKAIAAHTKPIELNPDFEYAYNDRGLAHAKRGTYREALADYAKAIELNADFSGALTREIAVQTRGDPASEPPDG